MIRHITIEIPTIIHPALSLKMFKIYVSEMVPISIKTTKPMNTIVGNLSQIMFQPLFPISCNLLIITAKLGKNM